MERLNKALFFTGLVVLLVASRLIPHAPNFTPHLAVLMLAGLFFANRMIAFSIGMGSILISDLILGFYPGFEWVYISYLALWFCGWIFRSQTLQAPRLLVVGGLGNLVFFLMSNFGVWLQGQMYAMNFKGLIECYIAALPFLRNSLVSTVVYGAALVVVIRYSKSYLRGWIVHSL